MARILYLEQGAGYGGSTISLLTSLRSGLAAWHHCTVGFYAESPVAQDFILSGAQVVHVRSRIAASRAARFAGRTSRVNEWRERTLGAGRASRFLEAVFRYPELVLKVVPLSRVVTKAIASHGIELVHLNGGPYWNLDSMLAAAWMKVPCICHLRSAKALTILEQSLANRMVKRFVAVSNAIKEFYVQQGLRADRITVIYNAREPVPVNPQERAQIRSSLDAKEEHTVFAFAGRILGRKGLGILLESVSRLAALRGDFCVWIVGDAGEKQAWAGRAEQLGVQDIVRFLGYRKDVYSILAAADAAVVPSLIPDAFPSVVLEAMAVGRPVIGSRIGGIPEAVVDGVTGFLVVPGEVEDLVNKMALLMDSPDLGRSMGLAGRQRLKQHFNPVQQVRLIDQVYQEVLR